MMLQFLYKIWSNDNTKDEPITYNETEINQQIKIKDAEIKKLKGIISERNKYICKLEKDISELIVENDILKFNTVEKKKDKIKENIQEDPGSRLVSEFFKGD